MRVLVIEDDYSTGEGLKVGLSSEGYAVDIVLELESALLALETHTYDIILLDIKLKDGSGLDLIAHLRTKGIDTPIIILTAYDKLQHKLNGLDQGADDYLTKPFKLEELMARMRAVSRRKEGRSSGIIKIGNLELDPVEKRVIYNNVAIVLGVKEFSIICMLMKRPHKIFSKEELESSLYGWNEEIESNVIEVYISNLRKKLGKKIIKTIKYMGYKLEIS